MKLVKRHDHKVKALRPVAADEVGPFWPTRRLESELDRFFNHPFGGRFSMLESPFEAWMPAVNIYEEKNNVIVKAELPGMKKDEFKIYLTGDTLNIAGERKAEHEEKTAEVYRSERYFGRFHRSITLPCAVAAEKIRAHYKDGILTITCPATEKARRKELEVVVD